MGEGGKGLHVFGSNKLAKHLADCWELVDKMQELCSLPVCMEALLLKSHYLAQRGGM